MEVTIGIIGLVLAVLIPLILYIKNKYGERPKLELEIEFESGASRPRGLSPKNDASKGYIEVVDAIQFFELEWRLKLKIRNHSDLAAYYTKMYYSTDSPIFTKLDKLPSKPILNSDEIILSGKYMDMEECRGEERNKVDKIPEKFNKLKIVLEYQNGHSTKFYTYYDHGQFGNKNTHVIRRPNNIRE